MKAAAYAGTRNLYEGMVTAVKSLLMHSDVDKVYLLIEDDDFPYPMPECVEAINVSGQTLFWHNSPNFNRKWTWMVLMKVAMSKVLPEDLDRVLVLDIDTIVVGDISELWDVPLGDNYFAGAIEPLKSEIGTYINMGVSVQNLQKLRDGKDDEIIYALNRRPYIFSEQDCIADVCRGHILPISSRYNACDFTEPTTEPLIVHFAFNNNWQREPLVKEYRDIPWSEVRGGLCLT